MLTQKERGILFRELIHCKGFTQKTFAKACGYPEACISRLCNGERPIEGVGFKTVLKFTKVLKVSSPKAFCDLLGIDLEKTNTVYVTPHASSKK